MTDTELNEAAITISDILMDARKKALTLPKFPGDLPTDLTDAYAIQNRSIREWDDEVAGWKVGGMPEDYIKRFGDKKNTGPVFRKNIIYPSAGETTAFPVFDGFAAVESEFVFEIGETPEDDKMFIGVEIASSPITDINGIGPMAVICDFGNNAGLIVGPEVENWRSLKADAAKVTTTINGEVCGTKEFTNFPDEALESLDFLRHHAARYAIDLPVGTLVSSGAITGVHAAKAGQSATCDFGQFGTFNIELISAKDAE